MINANINESENRQLSLADILEIIFKNKFIIVIFLIIGFILSLIYNYTQRNNIYTEIKFYPQSTISNLYSLDKLEMENIHLEFFNLFQSANSDSVSNKNIPIYNSRYLEYFDSKKYFISILSGKNITPDEFRVSVNEIINNLNIATLNKLKRSIIFILEKNKKKLERSIEFKTNELIPNIYDSALDKLIYYIEYNKVLEEYREDIINYETALLTIDMMIANKEKIVSYESPIKIYKSNSDRLVSFISTFFSFLIGIIFVLYMNVKRRN